MSVRGHGSYRWPERHLRSWKKNQADELVTAAHARCTRSRVRSSFVVYEESGSDTAAHEHRDETRVAFHDEDFLDAAESCFPANQDIGTNEPGSEEVV